MIVITRFVTVCDLMIVRSVDNAKRFKNCTIIDGFVHIALIFKDSEGVEKINEYVCYFFICLNRNMLDWFLGPSVLCMLLVRKIIQILGNFVQNSCKSRWLK